MSHWSEPSADGPLIYRYELVQEAVDGLWDSDIPVAPVGGFPGKAPSVVQRIVRNSAITQWVKELYDFTCQFCSIRLEVDAGAYAEGAHVRPLGGAHMGRDDVSNVLCLCPNDHVLFDKGALYVDSSLQVIRTSTGAVVTELQLDHYVNPGNFAYQRTRIAGQAD